MDSELGEVGVYWLESCQFSSILVSFFCSHFLYSVDFSDKFRSLLPKYVSGIGTS